MPRGSSVAGSIGTARKECQPIERAHQLYSTSRTATRAGGSGNVPIASQPREEEPMEIIRHDQQPAWLSSSEPWRLPIRFAVNRDSGAEAISIWQHYFTGEHRAPLHWHDTEEIL